MFDFMKQLHIDGENILRDLEIQFCTKEGRKLNYIKNIYNIFTKEKIYQTDAVRNICLDSLHKGISGSVIPSINYSLLERIKKRKSDGINNYYWKSVQCEIEKFSEESFKTIQEIASDNGINFITGLLLLDIHESLFEDEYTADGYLKIYQELIAIFPQCRDLQIDY